MDAFQLEEAEYKLILDCQTGCCLYKCGAERYNLVVKTPEHKLALYGTGGWVVIFIFPFLSFSVQNML